MPRTPINERVGFFSKVRGPNSNSLVQLLDWNAVDTELGPMVESRNLMNAEFVSAIAQLDVTDHAFSRIAEIDEDKFVAQYGSGGHQIPRDFNA